MAEVRKTVWSRSRDGLTEAERRFGGGLSDSLAEVRKTAWRRFERQIFFFAEARESTFFGEGSKDGVAKIWERALEKTSGS